MANVSGPGHATVVTLAIELVGVGVMSIIANVNPKLGKMMVTIMGGFMLMWFIMNANYFASIIGKAGAYAKP